MNKEYISIEQLTKITSIKDACLRTYLGRPEFRKFEKRIKLKNVPKFVYLNKKDFFEELALFLKIKKKEKESKLLINYWNMQQEINKDKILSEKILKDRIEELFFENKNIENELDLTSKQYNSLLLRYKEILLINKGLEKTFERILELCNEEADNMAVVELQNNIKAVINE